MIRAVLVITRRASEILEYLTDIVKSHVSEKLTGLSLTINESHFKSIALIEIENAFKVKHALI